MLSEDNIKDIIEEIQYEWTDEAERELQRQLVHWVKENENTSFIDKKYIKVPLNISDFFWNDLFTDVVQTIHKKVERKLKQFSSQSEDVPKGDKDD